MINASKDLYIKATSSGGSMLAGFSASTVEANPGDVITFTDLTDNSPTHWSWQFGDSGTSITQNPTHSYDSIGTYSVTLLAGKDGAGDIEVKTDYISIISAYLNEYSYSFTSAGNKYIDWPGGVSTMRYQITDPFSVSGWFKTSAAGNQDIITHWNSASPGWRVMLVGANLTFLFYKTTTNRIFVRSTNTFNDDTWKHFTVTYDGSGLASGVTLYVNGASESYSIVDDDIGSGTLTYATDLEIPGTTNYFNGKIDEISVYGKELSSVEVGELYNSGAPTNISNLSSYSDSDFWVRMGENDTWTGTEWAVVDEVNGNNGVSVNMVEADRSTDVPT